MDHDETPINAKIPRHSRVREALRSAAEQASWGLQRGVVWPLQDWYASLGHSSRTVLAGGGGVVGALFAVIVVSLAVGGGSSEEPATAAVAVATASTATTTAVVPAQQHEEAEPTLHGAPPVFKREPPPQVAATQDAETVQRSSSKSSSGEETAKTTEATTASSSSAATDQISSGPSRPAAQAASAEAGGVEGETEAIPGRPAGPKAIAVARRFSQAFVVYETGGKKAPVRKEFAATTTPALAKALLKRPPRLPADVKVPRAKVVTIVPGPSREGVYTLSVSLLRVGVTSELRLEMEKLKDEGWRVTNVLG
jgi:hypothetical protein